MHSITLKSRPDDVPAENDHRGDYIYGDNQARFLRPDWTLATVRAFMSGSAEPMPAICLRSLSMDTWRALETLLPLGGKETKAMRALCEYEDHYTERFNVSLYPLLLLTCDAAQYLGSPKLAADKLMLALLEEEEVRKKLERMSQGDASGSSVDVGRIPQVLLGTGYTRSCQPTDGSALLKWQFAELTNGDVLLLAGYEWLNK